MSEKIIIPPNGCFTGGKDSEIIEGSLYDEVHIFSNIRSYQFFSNTLIPSGQRMFIREIALTFSGLSGYVETDYQKIIDELFFARLAFHFFGRTSVFEYNAVECFSLITPYPSLKRRLSLDLLVCSNQIFCVNLNFSNFPSLHDYIIRVNLFGVTERVV
jgi:hypothetical protein